MNIYPENFEEKLNFNAIREHIVAKCLSPLGEELVFAMSFSSDYETVTTYLAQTHEFVQIIQSKMDFPTAYFLDMRHILIGVERDLSVWLSAEEVGDLVNSLETITSIVDFFVLSTTEAVYPELKKLADKVAVFPTILEEGGKLLDKTGQIRDNASRDLATIRKRKIEAEKDVVRSIQTALRSAQSQGLVAKDVPIDMRGGHFLIPVNASNKRKIKGVVRDSSGSGKTFFIEPETVVEASRRLHELENDERREIARLLTVFTNLVRGELMALMHAYGFMGAIDFIRAKALFAIRINGVMPSMKNRPHIYWHQAIHPLLDMMLRQENKRAEPLGIYLTEEHRILIISGVNAGGKSLCLKTTALLQYMLQCGILVPVGKNAEGGIFERLFLDIGDGQSLESSLSTYTSHLTHMRNILSYHDDRSLILIDEFGGGTEPQVGGAIAETLLERFNSKRSFGLITTHFQNLKRYAYQTEGVRNAAMLYDLVGMRPLYKLAIGTAGSAFAFEVARRIGLPEDVLLEASHKVVDVDLVLTDPLEGVVTEVVQDTVETVGVQIAEEIFTDIIIVDNALKNNTIRSLKKGDKVRVKGQQIVGILMEIQGSLGKVAFGELQSNIKMIRLELASD
ncbi:endonuclease MutS2 [Sphingobacterium paucimobilis]|nr:DNA mismatch repair protein MutS [Sphingobacterium paucimobilis]